MSENKKTAKKDAKKIVRLICFIFLTLALVVGIVFSSVKVNMTMIYGPEYNGAYQASVQVLKDGKAVNQKDKSGSVSNTFDLDKAAESLNDKLAPFSDKYVSISKEGKSHLSVLVGKQDYEDNQTFLRNQIQSNGGLYMLNTTPDKDGKIPFKDITLSDDGKSRKENSTNNDLFSNHVDAKTLSSGDGRKPYVELSLKNNGTNFKQLFETKDPDKEGSALFVSNLEEMIDSLRYLYLINDSDEAIDVYFNEIIKPLQDIVSKNENNDESKILKDLFGGTVNWQAPNSSVVYKNIKISLLEEGKFSTGSINVNGKQVDAINSEDDLKKVLTIFTPNTSAKPTSKFIYGANDKLTSESNTYKGWLDDKFSTEKTNTFNVVMNNLLPIVLKTKDLGKSVIPATNEKILKIIPTLNNYFIYNGAVTTDTASAGQVSQLVDGGTSFVINDNASKLNSGSSASTSVNDYTFYLKTKNLTAAKKAAASIRQNALGISYLVESISNVNPYVTSALYITSIVILSLIALLLAAYVLFVYRILGLFTFIVAACSIAIMLVIASAGFGIAFGPQTLAAMFVLLALVLDSNFVLFEGFKKNYYKNKHGVLSSFRIGNRETFTMVLDTVVIAFIPNLVLFWAGSGAVKTFGTMAIIGVALAVVCGIFIARFIYWLILKSNIISKYDWLLPIDTTYSSLKTMRDEYFINKYSHYLEDHEGKDKYTSKELAKISQYKKELATVQKQYHAHLLENNKATIKRDEKTIQSIKKNTELLTRFKNWFIKMFKIKNPVKQPIVRMIDASIDDNNVVTSLETKSQSNEESSQPSSKLQDKGKVVRTNRFVRRGSFWFIVGMVVLTIISAIVGGIVGPNWSSTVGNGQQFVIYGKRIQDIYDNTIKNNLGSSLKIDDKELIDEAEKLNRSTEEKNKAIDSDTKINDDEKTYQKSLNFTYAVADLLNYIDSNNKYTSFGFRDETKKIDLKKFELDVINNYQHVSVSDSKFGPADKDMIAIRINSSSLDKDSRTAFKRLLLYMWKPQANFPTQKPEDPTFDNDGGIVAYDISPYSINFQIKEICVALGITLAVLIVYILIRFKWTYYIALALGLVLTIGIVVALVVIFRVPVSAELLSAMSFILTFATTSMILVLGKGRSELNLEDKSNIKKNFSGEIKISASIREKKAQAKSAYAPLQKEVKRLKKEIHKLKKQMKKTGNGYDEYAKLEGDLNLAKEKLATVKKEQLSIYKDFKDKAKQKQNEEQRKNWYFKKLFSDLINYSAWRMTALGVFYLLVGIVLAITLPSIVGLGITIVFGILASFAVALFITVPVWIFFEKRRIRYVYGRKSYIESLKVSHEEETVPGIND